MKKIDVYIAQKIINLMQKYKHMRTKPTLSDNWEQVIKNERRFLHRLKNNLKIYLYKDSMLSKLIYNDFENMEETFIKSYLKTGDIFFDIGANIGFHTINAGHVLRESGRVYSFEPTKQTFDRLQENISLNNLDGVVKTMQIGLSDTITTLSLYVSDDFDACNSFADLKYITVNNHIEVPVYTAKHIIEQEDIPVNEIALVKLDVEGWEINVLKGMEDLFALPGFAPCFLVEFTEENLFRAGFSCRELYNYLKDKGYSWYSYDPELNTVTPSELKAYYPHENLIASKNYDVLKNRLVKVIEPHNV